MTESLFSPSWYRVAELRPRLRGHAQVRRHDYRGDVWYVLQDQTKGRFYRFPPAVYHMVGRMDGERTVQQLWEDAVAQLGDEGPTQTDVVQLLSQLHSADMLVCDVPPDTAELLRRSRTLERSRRLQNIRSPLSVRFPLFDPDRFLTATLPFIRPFIGWVGALLWLAVVSTAGVLAAAHWTDLTSNVVDRVLSAQNLVVIWLMFPLVKALHELGHGWLLKAWGAECREMGIMLLVLTPVPYVDASNASEFREKHRRVLVGAAGVLVELVVASVALFFWLALEPGAMRSLAWNTLLIGSVSSIFFNANPLLRFDGYYVMSDLVEVPNMAQRGLTYTAYLAKHYLFRMKKTEAPYTGPGERFWLVLYTVASFVYRAFIYTAIALFIAGKFFIIGLLLAIWAIFSMVLVPLGKGISFLTTSPQLRENRPRALAITGAALAVLGALLFVVPFPSWTRTEGVVWVPDESLVRAGSDGFVQSLLVKSGDRVKRGEPLVTCEDPLLESQAAVLRARLAELESRRKWAFTLDQVQAGILLEEIAGLTDELTRAEQRRRDLRITSPMDGVFLMPRDQDMVGRHLKRGDLIAYVVDLERPTVRAVVPQSRVDLVRAATKGVRVRLTERLDDILPAEVIREVPGAVERLPSTILGSAGGGEIAVNPADEGQTQALERLFQFDLRLGGEIDAVFFGSRAYVRFDHGTLPIGYQLYRSARQLFLKRFNV
jgi:putative peptide zinc metalloprotease protein